MNNAGKSVIKAEQQTVREAERGAPGTGRELWESGQLGLGASLGPGLGQSPEVEWSSEELCWHTKE